MNRVLTAILNYFRNQCGEKIIGYHMSGSIITLLTGHGDTKTLYIDKSITHFKILSVEGSWMLFEIIDINKILNAMEVD